MAASRSTSIIRVGQWLAPAVRGSATFRRNLPAPSTRYQTRFITNATKADSLLSVSRVAEKPGGWHPTLIHSSQDLKFTVIRLAPGQGEVPTHWHSQVWDYFVPLEGEAVIETKTKDGEEKEYAMSGSQERRSFLAVPPEEVHRVRNVSEDKEFVFLIVQAPRTKYDFVAGER